MSKEQADNATEDLNNGLSDNEIFNFNSDDFEEEEENIDRDYDGLTGDQSSNDQDGAPIDTPALDQNNEEEEEDKFDFEENKDDASDDEIPEDVLEFNKKFDTDFKSEQEMRDALNGVSKKDETQSDEVELQKANDVIDTYTPYLEMSHSDLMREELKAQALRDKKDINDEYVLSDIEEEIQKYIDNDIIDIKADKIRDNLKKQLIDPATEKKTQIEQKTQQTLAQQEKEKDQKLQDALVGFHQAKSFYGIKTDKKELSEVYKNVKNGDFIKQLTNDPNLQAELATMAFYKETLYKNASGLTYSDGIKSVKDEFKTVDSKNDRTLTRAQKRGSSAGIDSQAALIASLTK